MKYELRYKCKHCEEDFNEIISEERINNIIEDEIMSEMFLYKLFHYGWKAHKCYNDWNGYGRVTAIRPVEE